MAGDEWWGLWERRREGVKGGQTKTKGDKKYGQIDPRSLILSGLKTCLGLFIRKEIMRIYLSTAWKIKRAETWNS